MNTSPDAAPVPRQRNPQARQRAMIAAAIEIMVEGGPAALTHRAVAARAQVAVGTTTRYFESIDALRAAALAAMTEEINRTLDDIADGLRENPGDVDHLVDAISDFLADEWQVKASAALWAAAISHQPLRELALHWTHRFTDILAAHFGPHSATALQFFLDGAMMFTQLTGAPPPRTQLAAAVAGLAATPGGN